jgi:hypothetical protein
MSQVSELIQKTLEDLDNRAMESAFARSCAAIEATLKKTLETEELSRGDYQNFINGNWRLIAFMGMPRALPMPPDVNAKLQTDIHGFNIRSADELILHLVMQTARMGRLPVQFKLHHNFVFESRDNHIYIPTSLINGLLGLVIFQPANKDETVGEKYWISIADFKMFVSELWGRMDLAERIMSFYLR